uniref:Obscurin-like protein 1 n=1 Tax=Scleropages formosus TaxID=113540 RepID=A0A8C9RW87_SCLFO
MSAKSRTVWERPINMYSNWTLEGKVVEGPGDTLKVNGIEGGLPGVCNGDQTLKVEDEGGQRGSPEDNAPHVLIRPLSTRVHLSDDVTLSCKLWGQPLPEVTWEKDGRQLSEIFESAHFSMGYQDGGWFQLSIFGTRAPDAGVYTCRAKNEFGEALAGAVLLVDKPSLEEEYARNGYPRDRESHQSRRGRHHGPQLREDLLPSPNKVKNFAVTEGKHAKFRCFVTGKPKPDIVWSKDGHPIVAGRRHLLYEDREGYFTLKVLYCKQQDNGTYVCSASNMAGHTLSAVHLSVKEPRMRFRQSLRDVEVREKGLAVLECEVPEESVPTTWYLEDHRLQEGPKYGMEEWGRRRRLTIRDVGMDDDGIYLCEMADGGRSIAEVAVKGTIVRKLPRKLEVLEGENAAFFVEVEEDEMEVKWYKDGLQLWDTHQTIIKSFGKTHILVFVNTVPQDSGVVTFTVGRSKTTSKLKVKAARHAPPSCPAGAWISSDRTNTVLLSWGPVQDVGKGPPTGYVVERQEVGSHEWVQCLTTEGATSAELPGDNVPREAEYRFRVCSVNKYGRSGHVEFPGSVHLTPIVKIQTHLEDAVVHRGQDASFTVELTASVSGTWFWNGTKIEDDSRFSTHHSDTQHLLHIQKVQVHEHGAEITFTASGVRDSALLRIRGTFVGAPEMEKSTPVVQGGPIVLQCELTDPSDHVCWYKDGEELFPQRGIDIQSEGATRRLMIPSANLSDAGVYSCTVAGEAIHFNVNVQAPPVKFKEVTPEDVHKRIVELDPLVLECEVSRPDAEVRWYKDGNEKHQGDEVKIQSSGTLRRLIIQSAQLSDSGTYVCRSGDSEAFFTVTIQPPVMIVHPKEDVPLDHHISEEVILSCELSRSSGLVHWYKDGQKLQEGDKVVMKSEGPYRRLVIPCSTMEDSGEYVCDTGDDSAFFQLSITEAPVHIVSPSQCRVELVHQVSESVVLSCELSKAEAEVHWYCNGLHVENTESLLLEVDGAHRRLVIPGATFRDSDSGEYLCDAGDDTVAFTVVSCTQEPHSLEVGGDLILACEVSRPNAPVQWYCNERLLSSDSRTSIESYGTVRKLILSELQPSDSGKYTCDAVDDKMVTVVKVQEPPVQFLNKDKANVAIGYENESVTLTAQVSRDNATVQWMRDWTLLSGDRFHMSSEGSVRLLTIDPLQSESVASRDAFEMMMVEFLAELHNTTVLEGEDATFKCVVSPEDVLLMWYRDGEPVTVGDERVTVSRNGLCHTLHIHRCQLSDSGRVTRRGELTLHIEYLLSKMEPVAAEEYADATLEVEVNLESAEVQWMRQGVVIQSGPKYTVGSSGQRRSLTIHSLGISDRGTYCCETLHDRTQGKLIVERECRPYYSLSTLRDIETFEYEAASFEVELSHANVEGVWQKDGLRLKSGHQARLSTKGRLHSLTLSSITLEDAGTIVFSAEGARTSARLTVKEPPVTFLRKPEDLCFPEGALVSIECELSRQNADVKWLKVRGASSECAKSRCVPKQHLLGMFPCTVNAPWRPDVQCRSHSVERVVEIVQPLEDLDIQEDQNAVFMCEVSRGDVQGQWFWNEERIRPTSTVKIRQEGTKHFLLMCNVKPEDSGEIKFIAREAESIAYLEVEELPATIVKPLRDRTALENHRVILECTVSTPRCDVRWFRGDNEISPSQRFEICSEGCYHKLVIHQLRLEDEGSYSVCVGEHTSSARLMVEGEKTK